MNHLAFILSIGMWPMAATGPVQTVTVSGRAIAPQGVPTGVNYPIALMEAETEKRVLATPDRVDGSFEFRRIPPGRYVLRSPAFSGSPLPLVVSGNQNLENIEVPLSMKEFTGHLKVEGVSDGASRRFAFIAGDDSGFLTSSVGCEPDGTFRIALPEGKLRLSLVAAGHKVKAFSYGTQDLLRDKTTELVSTNSATFEVTLGPDDKSSEPQVIYQVMPDISEEGVPTAKHGSVELSVIVNTDGSVGIQEVRKALDRTLDALASKAVKKWGFLPATHNGVPVAKSVTITFKF